MKDKNVLKDIEHIKYLISKGSEFKALRVLDSVVKEIEDDRVKTDFILIKNQLARLNKKEYLGFSDDTSREKNDLIYRLLQLVDTLKNDPQALNHIERKKEEIETAVEETIFSIKKTNKKLIIYISLGFGSVALMFVGVPVLIIVILLIIIIFLVEWIDDIVN